VKHERRNPISVVFLAIWFSLGALAAESPTQITVPSATPPAEAGGFDLNMMPTAAPNSDLFAFASYSSKLVADDTNGCSDVFLWSRADGAIRLISKGTNGAASGPSYDPALSKDGRFVAFVSRATNMPAHASGADVIVADVQSGAMELITVSAQTAGKSGLSTRNTVIGADGRYVGYVSRRYDVISGTSSTAREHVFVRDRAQGTTVWANRTLDVPAAMQALAIFDSTMWLMINTNLYAFGITNSTLDKIGSSHVEPAFSSDGSLVALQFLTSKTNVVQRYHVATKEFETLVATSNTVTRYSGLSISDNGRIAFLADAKLAAEDTDTNIDLYVTPAVGQTGPLTLASSATAPGVTKIVSNPALTADGLRVYFRVFTKGNTGRTNETLVRDLSTGASEAVGGNSVRQNLSRIFVSAGGVFMRGENQFGFAQPSDETDLVFLAAPSANADSDNDGLPDAWEIGVFGSLANDGSGDADGDGMTNLAEYLAEYLAGTDPTRADSVLRLELVDSAPVRHLIYPGSLKPLTVEYRDSLGAGQWTSLQTQSTESDGRPSSLDSASVTQRFYRIRILP
jgi:hypothetical protein